MPYHSSNHLIYISSQFVEERESVKGTDRWSKANQYSPRIRYWSNYQQSWQYKIQIKKYIFPYKKQFFFDILLSDFPLGK